MNDADDRRPDGSVRFNYDPGVLRYGRGCIDGLSDELAEQGFERALVITGSTVGETPAVIDPVTAGLDDRLAGVFARTTPEKRLDTAYEALGAARSVDADVLVSLGGGSSLDTAKIVSVLAASEQSPREVGRELAERGSIPVPSSPLPPVVAIPTTLAGSDLSTVAGVTASPTSGLVDDPASGGVSDPRLMPAAVFYDPELFATTPGPVLAASLMNGFDKGIETLYARTATPITDATAVRGLGLLAAELLETGGNLRDERTLAPVVEGTMLVQYGISRPDATTLSLVHAFGHGLTRTYDVQQGSAHAVVAPHVLRYLFENCHGRRDLLAEALGVGDAPDAAEAVVGAVADVRDALDLPSRLRDVDGPEPAEFPAVSEAILADAFLRNAPADLDPTAAEIAVILREAW